MENKFRPVTYLSFFVLIIGGIFIFSGCSTFSKWFSSSDTPANVNGIEKKEFKKFMATVKPIHGDAKNQYRLARHFQKQGRHEIAVEEFIKALKIDPQNYNAYNALGVSYDCLKKFNLARDAYRAALKLNPSLDYVYNNLGYSNLLKGDFQKAALAFEQAIVLNDQNKTYQNNLLLVQAKLGTEVQAEVAVPVRPAPVLSREKTVEFIEQPAGGVADTSSHEEIVEERILQSKIQKNFYAVQLGAYTDINKAKNHLRNAVEKGYDHPYITKVERNEPYKPYYRVRFGKFASKQEADSIRAAIKNGKPTITIVENYPINVFSSDPQNGIVNKEYSIEISNGNGAYRMARRMGNYLSNKGYNVKKISNASNFNHHQTIIYYYPGFYGQAQQLTQQIPGFQEAGRLVESNQIKKNIKVVIGKDIIPFAPDFKKVQQNS